MTREKKLKTSLAEAFNIDYMLLENESHMHSVPENSETHFKLVLVSDDFDGKRKVARHQAVYSAVNTEMQSGLHALALHLYTNTEWAELDNKQLASPNCMGGSKKG
ncbi:transcriptional regulator BolA [Oleiphilus sp. HI0125]|uniref:BolA family protein n=1 Tax=Oleiphilus sp. HI0125 TaxID=1822266 RepID=UPI0007C3039D|nr:BolA/IbaG family iron-sulfur metabolism protein [Oleiphilus sp. HI0125]KZZ58644.1 transcriptional regulator BolA [Oleiphilus sp. HI0125]